MGMKFSIFIFYIKETQSASVEHEGQGVLQKSVIKI